MAIVAKFNFSNSTTVVADFATLAGPTLGTTITSGSITATVTSAFQNSAFADNAVPLDDPIFDIFPRAVLVRHIVANQSGGAITYSGLTPGATYRFDYMCPSDNALDTAQITDGVNTVQYVQPANPTVGPVTEPAELISIADVNGEIVHSCTAVPALNVAFAAVIVNTIDPPKGVVSINGGSTVRAGSVGNTLVTTGNFTPTSGTIGTLAVTNISGIYPNFVFDVPSVADENISPLYGATVIAFSDAEDTINFNIDYLPKTGYSYVTLGSNIETSVNGIVYQFSPTAAQGDQIAYPTATVTVASNGTAFTTSSGTFELEHLAVSDNTLRVFELLVGNSEYSLDFSEFVDEDPFTLPFGMDHIFGNSRIVSGTWRLTTSSEGQCAMWPVDFVFATEGIISIKMSIDPTTNGAGAFFGTSSANGYQISVTNTLIQVHFTSNGSIGSQIGANGDSPAFTITDEFEFFRNCNTGEMWVELNGSVIFEITDNTITSPMKAGVFSRGGSISYVQFFNSIIEVVSNPGLRIDVNDVNGDPVADFIEVGVVVYDSFGGTELFQTGVASVSGGIITIDNDSIGNIGDVVYVVIHLPNSDISLDMNGCGRQTVVDLETGDIS